MSREQNIQRIKNTKYYIDGARFSAKDMLGRLNGRKKNAPKIDLVTVNRLLSIMKDRNMLVDYRTNHHTGGRTTKWARSKGSTNWLQLPWRKHSDEQLGIES